MGSEMCIRDRGITRQTDQGVELRVHPTLVPETCLIAGVNDVSNAVMVNADAVGTTLFYGPGAGSEPTASSVIADIVDVARAMNADADTWVPALGCQSSALQPQRILKPPLMPLFPLRNSPVCCMKTTE